MAGDWIKIEHVTPDKPEVIMMADALHIDQDGVFGKLCRLWIWADQQTRIGDADSVTETFVDRVAGVRGFATAMISCGWLIIEKGTLRFPNFDRHNGETAKTRALTQKRTRRYRDGLVTQPASPRARAREEKSIKEIKKKETLEEKDEASRLRRMAKLPQPPTR